MSPEPRDPFDSDEQSEYSPDTDPSVFSEPWIAPSSGSGSIRDEPAHGASQADSTPVEQGVWQEPALLERSTPPEDARTWTRWFRERQANTTAEDSLKLFAVVCLLGGPFAVIGTMFSMVFEFMPAVSVVVIGPATEEVLKTAAVFYVVERRPYLFKSAAQIVLAVGLSGLVFATIENILYLNIYIEDPTPAIRAWRWYACTALHVSCSLIASIGLARIWRRTDRTGEPPELGLGAQWLIAAVVVHGLYNFSALMVETFLKPF